MTIWRIGGAGEQPAGRHFVTRQSSEGGAQFLEAEIAQKRLILRGFLRPEMADHKQSGVCEIIGHCAFPDLESQENSARIV
jgi:hypothetical protein